MTCPVACIQMPKEIGEVLDVLMGDLDSYLGELGEEMRAIAECLDIDLGVVVTLNFAYELRRVCSILCMILSYVL